MDPETIWDRVSDAINTIIRRDESTETGELLPPCVEGTHSKSLFNFTFLNSTTKLCNYICCCCLVLVLDYLHKSVHSCIILCVQTHLLLAIVCIG